MRGRGGGGCGVSANEYMQLYPGAQIKFGYLTPYLIYATKEGPLSYVLLESPLASVLIVGKGHASKVYLVFTQNQPCHHSIVAVVSSVKSTIIEARRQYKQKCSVDQSISYIFAFLSSAIHFRTFILC
jgi:hypothetical protein